MKTDDFLILVRNLTGTPLKGLSDRDRAALAEILADDDRVLDCSQFNELLLLVNKDRVEQCFYDYFFNGSCRIGNLKEQVELFQIKALLAFGNFVFAYRTFSKMKTKAEIEKETSSLCIEGLKENHPSSKLLEISKIARDDTPLVGYLSTSIIAEAERAKLLMSAAEKLGESATWTQFENLVKVASKPEETPALLVLLSKFKDAQAKPTDSIGPATLTFLRKMAPRLESRRQRLVEVQEQGIKNQDIYLTWNEMDVYFATSMRKAWEYRDLFEFIDQLMSSRILEGMNIRYFDPTQSYTPNRIDKGLVESLMLKRAKCTIYSVQDTDTLGKDSELAATLAQGKPVIAFIPEIEENSRAKQLMSEDPVTMLERLRFVLYADEKFRDTVSREDRDFLKQFQAVEDFYHQTAFFSVSDVEGTTQFKKTYAAELERLCRIIAASEKRVYNKRADTLKSYHPLAVQVNLDTGVANGLLIARTISECAVLLKRLLLHTKKFRVEESDEMWYLRDDSTNSIFRVVTKNIKISNCFWNFYLKK